MENIDKKKNIRPILNFDPGNKMIKKIFKI